jgi:hypothetical protein
MKVVGENRRKVAAAEAASSQHMGVQSGKEETKKNKIKVVRVPVQN